MHKYIYLLKVNLSLVSTYRTDLIFAWLYRLFQMLVVYALWSVTQTTEAELHRLFLYFALFYLFFDSITTAKISRWMSHEVREGTLSSYLVKPINFPLVLWIKQLGIVIARIVVPFLLFIIFSFIRPDIFAPEGVVNFLIFLITTVLGAILWNMFSTLIGTISFWVVEIAQLQNAINLILNIVIGRYISVYLFSDNIENIISLTPANYFGNFQILIYQGQLNTQDIIKGIVVMSVWTIFFFLLARFNYNRGLKNYEASGN